MSNKTVPQPSAGLRELRSRPGSLPNEDAALQLVGALRLEPDEAWAVTRRTMPMETLQTLCHPDDVNTPSILAAA